MYIYIYQFINWSPEGANCLKPDKSGQNTAEGYRAGAPVSVGIKKKKPLHL